MVMSRIVVAFGLVFAPLCWAERFELSLHDDLVNDVTVAAEAGLATGIGKDGGSKCCKCKDGSIAWSASGSCSPCDGEVETKAPVPSGCDSKDDEFLGNGKCAKKCEAALAEANGGGGALAAAGQVRARVQAASSGSGQGACVPWRAFSYFALCTGDAGSDAGRIPGSWRWSSCNNPGMQTCGFNSCCCMAGKTYNNNSKSGKRACVDTGTAPKAECEGCSENLHFFKTWLAGAGGFEAPSACVASRDQACVPWATFCTYALGYDEEDEEERLAQQKHGKKSWTAWLGSSTEGTTWQANLRRFKKEYGGQTSFPDTCPGPKEETTTTTSSRNKEDTATTQSSRDLNNFFAEK